MDGLRGKELEEAYWYNTHRSQIRTVAYGLGIGAVAVLWLANSILWIGWWLRQDQTNAALEDLATTHVIYDSIRAPSALQVTVVDAVPDSATSVSGFAIIHNPNSHHVGRFNYTMTINGTAYPYTDGVVLPNADAYLVVSGIAGTTSSSASLALGDVQWQRLRGPTPQTEFVLADLLLQRTNLTSPTLETTRPVTDQADFATPDEEVADVPLGASITQLTGMMTNASAYGFRTVSVTAVVKNTADTVIAIQQQVLRNVPSFSAYNLIFSWQRQFEFNAEADVMVETDVSNTANLILPGEE